jgi:hypothetical protein
MAELASTLQSAAAASNDDVPPASGRWLYPEHYPWFLGLALLDVALTWIVLGLGSQELNALARTIVAAAGLAGLLAFKLAAVAAVLAICQYIGARRWQVGRRIMDFALAANTVPVTLACLYLAAFGAGLLGA